MKYNKVIIKQIPESNPTAINMDKYNRSRFPDCFDIYTPAQLSDGRYLTGLDPYGIDVMSIKDESLKSEKIQEIETILKELNTTLQNRVDLSSTSDFWDSDSIKVKISSNSDLILNKANPLDVLKYHYLIANGYVAPSIEKIGEPKYINASYYCHVEEIETNKTVSYRKLIDSAKAILSKISENKEMLYLIGAYLEGTRYKKTMTSNTLYLMLSDYIEDNKNKENVEKFLKASKLSIEDLQFKITIETAIRKKLIKYKDGYYHIGVVNLGKTPIDVMNNLKTPEYANEFLHIYEELNSK